MHIISDRIIKPGFDYTLATGATWLSVPTDQMVISTAGGFTFNLLNPDPGTHVDFPGYGDELGETVNWALKTNAGKTVNFFVQRGAKFANKSEWTWAQRLLNEGNNVMLWKDVEQSTTVSVRNADLLVNGVETEIKEPANMTVGPNLVRNLVNKFKDAAGQASSVTIDGTKQKGFTREVAEQTLKDLGRKLRRIQILELSVMGLILRTLLRLRKIN